MSAIGSIFSTVGNVVATNKTNETNLAIVRDTNRANLQIAQETILTFLNQCKIMKKQN